MAKKRRDKQRDPSTSQRVTKFAAVALSVGFGATSLYRRGGAEALAATIKTGSTIASDLAGKKKTALNLESAFKKRIGKNGSEYKKLLDGYKKGNNKIRFNTKDTKNIFGYITASKQALKNREALKEAHLRKNLTKTIKNQKKIIKERGISLSDKQNKKLEEIIRDAYISKGKRNTVYEKTVNGKPQIVVNEDFHKSGFEFLGKDIQKIKTELMGNVYYARTAADDGLKELYEKEDKHFLQQVLDKTYDPDNIASTLGKKDKDNLLGKTNKIIDEHLDIDIAKVVNKDTRKATLEDLYHEIKAGNTDIFDLESIKGYVANKDAKNKYEVASDNINDFIKLMEKEDNFDKLKDVYVGGGLRVREKVVDGETVKEFYSTHESDEIIKGFMSKVADTMPGRLFKGIDIKQTMSSKLYNVFKEGDIHPYISAALEHEGEDRLKNTYLSIGKKMYQVVSGEDMHSLVDVSGQVGDISFISTEHGSLSRMAKNMFGTDRIAANESNRLLNTLDIAQTGQPSIFSRSKAYLGKFKNKEWGRNQIDNVIKHLDDNNSIVEHSRGADGIDYLAKAVDLTDDEMFDLVDNLKTLDKAFDAYTASNKLSDDTLAKLLYATNEEGEKLLQPKSQALLRTLIKGDIGEAVYSDTLFEEALNGPKDVVSMIKVLSSEGTIDGDLLSLRNQSFANKKLASLVSKITNNTESNLDLLNISSKQSKIPLVGDLVSTDVSLIDDVMRREMIKEVLMAETKENPDFLFDIIDSIDVSSGEERTLKILQNWSVIQNDIIDPGKAGNLSDEALQTVTNFFRHTSEYTSEYKNDLSYNMNFVAKDRFSVFDKGTFENTAERYSSDYGAYTAVKKSKILSMLENLNDFEKFKASASEVGKELFAGRHDAENISLLTFAPYFMVSRLNDGVEDLGIGLSHLSAGSTIDLIKNIALKRILPVASAFHAYDYLNYEAENFFGTSITGAFANGIANLDMATRKGLDATGLSSVIDWMKEPNVIAEYWTGSRDFQTAEERQEWYEDGYSPVRSGRWWSFGSSSEYRGGDISYFQPNFVKRANSNWREIGIYGSAEDKFKHSLIPTLRHPFSTIDYLLDPYWLEKKNMDLRPYPYTGKMFSEGTPWGAVLNPTIGQIIKPVTMLPEIRERLGSGTVDAKQIIHDKNERIKARANSNDDMLIANGTDIRNATYVPFAYATPGETLAHVQYGNVSLQGVDYMEQAPTINSANFVPDASISGSVGALVAQGGAYGKTSDALPNSNKFNKFINKTINIPTEDNVLSILSAINADIRSKASTQSIGAALPQMGGAYTYNNPYGNLLVNYANFYERKESGMAKSTSLSADFLADAGYSASQLSGIYSFLGDMAFGEQSYTMKLADAGQMTSFTRGFWDANIGGFGGGLMEIARRFFPHEDRSRIAYNPLRNEMEQWLPERFLTGDAYASIPKGEMRLPGKGYESIYELHPDEFGEYGAFDRMKILGDIAPSSDEYKIWRKIAQETVTDPNLLKKMKEIEERATKSMDDHEFYEYRYFNNPTDTKTGIVKSINSDGTVSLADGTMLSLAGVEMESADGLYEMLSAGQKITYRTAKDVVRRFDEDTIDAIIYKSGIVPRFSENINKSLVDMGYAEEKTDSSSGLSYLATASTGQEIIGSVFEAVAHAPIPFIHNKLMKIESSLEAYQNEILYGSSFQTWDNPIEGFVKPAFKQQNRKSLLEEAFAVGSWYAFGSAMKSDSAMKKIGASALMITANPTALLGGGIGFGLKMGLGGGYALKGAHIGAALGHVSWGLANADDPLKAAISFGSAAHLLNDKLELGEYLASKTQVTKIAEDVLDKTYETFGRKASKETIERLSKSPNMLGKMATIAAVGVGLSVSAYKNAMSIYDGEGISATKPYIPDDVKERWELDEYFDRLSYVKYMSLYHEAARKAEMLENSDIRKVFAKIDQNKKKIAKLQHKAQKASNKYTSGSPEYQAVIAEMEEEIQYLQMSEQVFNGGKYTKAAVAYKKLAESTIYGLSETATMDEILRAAPEQYKDYIKAFGNETNKQRRKEILKLSSPYVRKLLQISWGEEPSKVDSNLKYFKNHKMPSMAWKGWKPNVNIKHVKMKTIENEGMLLSDFGFYESEKSKAAYYEAPDIKNYDVGSSSIFSKTNLITSMSGFGLTLQNVSVEPTSAPGLWIVGDITRNVSDSTRGLGNKLVKMFL